MRIITLIVSLITAIVVIALLTRLLPPDAASVMLDIKRSSWPFTVQNVLWLAFFVGLGELSIRWRAGRLEESQINRNYLPEDEETVLRPGDDITPIYQKVRASKYREVCFVPRLIERCVLGFNLSHSADQTNSLLIPALSCICMKSICATTSSATSPGWFPRWDLSEQSLASCWR